MWGDLTGQELPGKVPQMADVVIEVEGLVKRYGEILAVAGISFSVEKGEVFGLLGPNGAGKTTTVECIEGLRIPDSGEIKVLGMRAHPNNHALKARLGIQLQGTAFLPRLTVEETLRLFASFYPRSLPVGELLELVALREKRRSQVKTLSGGQRQRLALAMALVNDPEVLILDEPTAGLDPQARRSLWDLITSLKGRGKTVLITTHYLEEAECLCDRVLILDHGQIIALGSPKELISKQSEGTPIEIHLGSGSDGVDLRGLPGVKRAVREEDTVVLYSTSPVETIRAVSLLSSEGKLVLEDLVMRRVSLEDVYLILTGRRIRE